MAVFDMVNLSGLLDEAKCFELVRQHRWPDGVRCPDCCTARSFWDTGLKPTLPWRLVEGASDGTLLG
jgi:hypothetical protein